MAFQEVNTDLGGGDRFKFVNAGDNIEGNYLGDDTLNISGKEVLRHTFKTKKGATVSVLGSFKLNEVMEKVTPGQMVRITFTGIKKLPGGKTLKNFKLEVDPTGAITVTTASGTSTTAAAIAAMKAE